MKIFHLSFILFFSVFSVLQAQNLQEEKAVELLDRYQELKRFNGAALVAQNQKVIFTKGVGMADYEHSIPIQHQTKFLITGLTEQFTAYIALKVFEEEGLSLESSLNQFFENSIFKKGGLVTLHHLLSHTSGLPDFPLIHELPKQQVFSKKDLIEHVDNLIPENQPGTAFMHSKLNYTLLGLVLEKVTGKPFGQLLKEYVTTPIGMENTSLNDLTTLEMHRARGYFRRDYEVGWENAPYLHPSNTFSAQGILSTTEDMLKWHTYVGINHLQDKALQRMLTTGYGLQAKRNAAGQFEEIRSMGGYSSGFNSFSSIRLVDDLTVIVLGNNRNPSSEDIADGLAAIFKGMEYTLPLPRKVVKVDALSLQKLAGEYKMNKHVTVRILVEGNKVFVNDGMRPNFEVFPQSENQFFVEGADAEIVFIKNDDGEVIKIGLRNDGFTNAYAERVN